MSTREQHPIDDHFRRTLAAAEVEPPAHVWAGVAAAQRGNAGRKGFLLLSLLVLIGVGAAGTLYFFGRNEGPAESTKATNVHGSTDAVEPGTVQGMALPVIDATSEEAVVPIAAVADNVKGQYPSVLDREERDPVAHKPALAAIAVAGSAQAGNAPGPIVAVTMSAISTPVAKTKGTHPAQDGPPPAAGTKGQVPGNPPDQEAASATADTPPWASVPDASTTWATGLDMRPGRMHILPPMVLFMESQPALRRASSPAEPYVLASSEWWVGPSVGVIGSRLRWRGDDAELAEAINKVGGVRHDLALGIAFGRTWRSGWSLSSGIMWQQGQQHRTLVDRRTVVEQEFISRVVSLDAVVLFSTTDTLTTTTTTETALGGVERSTVLRIPLQAHWHGTRGRLLYGAHLGVALEHTTYRGGPTLARDASDGRIAPVQNGTGQGQERFPLTLLGTAGLDVGLQLHERWALRGGPVLMHGLAPLQRASPVFAMPDRWGLQFHLVHHLYRRSTQ